MQLTLRIDDNNYVTYAVKFSPADPQQPSAGPELIAATLSDSKLSLLSQTDILDLTAQIVDYFSVSQSAPKNADDWQKDWLAATTGHES